MIKTTLGWQQTPGQAHRARAASHVIGSYVIETDTLSKITVSAALTGASHQNYTLTVIPKTFNLAPRSRQTVNVNLAVTGTQHLTYTGLVVTAA